QLLGLIGDRSKQKTTSDNPGSLQPREDWHLIKSQGLESGELFKEYEIDRASGPITLLGDYDLSFPLVVFPWVVNFFTINEADHIGILFNGAAFTEVAELRLMVPTAGFGGAGQLRQSHHGQVQFLCEGLEVSRYLGNLLLPGFDPAASRHQLHVIYDE